MDTLKATIDNLINAGFVVRAGNANGGLSMRVEGVLRCEACGSIVPAQFRSGTGCVNCQPGEFDGASTGTGKEPTP